MRISDWSSDVCSSDLDMVVRGGAAQVGVVSSALQGSISGSVISNVISSGVVTIPAMKRTGFRADYAGGVEAVASTGDRKSVGQGKIVSVRVELGGRHINKKQNSAAPHLIKLIT